jgi:hypothetical protein
MSYAVMISGFMLAAYAIVANDALQTLGPFLSANAQRPWWLLWLFACGVLCLVFFYGWWAYNGDISYGRLTAFPVPDPFHWYYIIPPLTLLVLTQFGIPTSTTFLILTVFAPGNLEEMVLKSLLGYGLAFGVAAIVYWGVSEPLEKAWLEKSDQPIASYWIALQWGATAFLWVQWLIQDLANIFVYLPRNLTLPWLSFALVVMLALHGIIFYRGGGEIEKIITSKTNTQDIRSATVINFLYGLILLFFIEYSQMPMSTTWVFIGLLAGRELAIANTLHLRPLSETAKLIGIDIAKTFIGLIVSIALAFGLPLLAQ